jgi:hypothetical protein
LEITKKMNKNLSALKVTLKTSDILQNAIRSESNKQQPYHYLWAFLRHHFDCKTMRDVDFFNREKTRDFLHCIAHFTHPLPTNEIIEIKQTAYSKHRSNEESSFFLVKEFFESHGDAMGKVNFYQLPTYVLRHLQMKLLPYMKPSYWGKYVYEECVPIILDDDMCNVDDDENKPPNTTTVRKALENKNVLRKSFDYEEEEMSFF